MANAVGLITDEASVFFNDKADTFEDDVLLGSSCSHPGSTLQGHEASWCNGVINNETQNELDRYLDGMPDIEQVNSNISNERRNSACFLDDLLQDGGSLPVNVNGNFSVVFPDQFERNSKMDPTIPKLPPCSKLLNRDVSPCLSSQMPFQQVLQNNMNNLPLKNSSCNNNGGVNCPSNNHGVTIKSEPQEQYSMQCNGNNGNHGISLPPGGLSVECFMTIKQEPSHIPCSSSSSPLTCNQQNQLPPAMNQYKFSFNCLQQSHQNMNMKSCQQPLQQQQPFINNTNYFCQMPPTPPNSHPGSPANPTQQHMFPQGFIDNSVLRGPPPPYDFAVATEPPLPLCLYRMERLLSSITEKTILIWRRGGCTFVIIQVGIYPLPHKTPQNNKKIN
ncbi:uncharacterized protein [Amphiura filiformis]|uniref:uncharacterized protein n=1 Tax=Amphiura filiformis TaxID=82378 RepID=UPI003B21B0FF